MVVRISPLRRFVLACETGDEWLNLIGSIVLTLILKFLPFLYENAGVSNTPQTRTRRDGKSNLQGCGRKTYKLQEDCYGLTLTYSCEQSLERVRRARCGKSVSQSPIPKGSAGVLDGEQDQLLVADVDDWNEPR